MPRLIFASAVLLGVSAMPAAAQPPSNPEMPDPLVTAGGKAVTAKADWPARRAELKELFQRHMYGRYPAVTPKVSGQVVFEDAKAFGGKGTLREVALTMADGAPPVHVLLAVPNDRKGPAPAFVGLSFAGIHTLTTDPRVGVTTAWVRNGPGVKDNKATAADRGKQADVWPLADIVGRGYAVAVFYIGEVIPDDPKVRGGLGDLLMPESNKASADATGAVMAWAWGAHRVLDHLTTLPEIDAKKVAVIGHSRLGKAALVATAFDDRVAVGFPHQSGCGGAGPSRSKNPKAETVKRITAVFPHWFAPAFTAFGDDPSKLPFDQNALVAVCAPRPVLLTNATDDQWANPPGQFDVLAAASPAYKLVAGDGLAADALTPEGKFVDSRLGYWVRPGKHEMNRSDWRVFLAYADKWLK